jgi:hypothetical protein
MTSASHDRDSSEPIEKNLEHEPFFARNRV